MCWYSYNIYFFSFIILFTLGILKDLETCVGKVSLKKNIVCKKEKFYWFYWQNKSGGNNNLKYIVFRVVFVLFLFAVWRSVHFLEYSKKRKITGKQGLNDKRGKSTREGRKGGRGLMVTRKDTWKMYIFSEVPPPKITHTQLKSLKNIDIKKWHEPLRPTGGRGGSNT